jgi:hypothetical protein
MKSRIHSTTLQPYNMCTHLSLGRNIAIKIKPLGNYPWISEVFLGKINSIHIQKSSVGVLLESQIIYSTFEIGMGFDHSVIIADIFDCIKIGNYSKKDKCFRHDFTNVMCLANSCNESISDELLEEMNTDWKKIPRIHDLKIKFL